MPPAREDHIRAALELGAVYFESSNYLRPTEVERGLEDFWGEAPGRKRIERALESLQALSGLELFEGRAGRGRRVRPSLTEHPDWQLPLLARFAALAGIGEFHPALTALVHSHGARALSVCARFARARDTGRTIEFQYARSGSEQPELKRLQVADLRIRGNRLIAAGRDLHKGLLRQYLLVRVTYPIRLLGAATQRAEHGALRRLYERSLGVFLGGRPTSVVIRFDPSLAADVRREYFHHTQELSEDNRGIVLRMTVNNASEVFSLISRYMGRAELISPEAWRSEYRERLEKALQLHRP